MFLKIIIILSLQISSAWSAEITVSEGLRSYNLKYGSKYLEFNADNVKLSLYEKPCDKNLLQNFQFKTDKMLKGLNKLKNPKIPFIKINTGTSDFYTSAMKPQGQYFLLIPNEIKRLKIEEDLRCKK